jgi:Nuclease-related domain
VHHTRALAPRRPRSFWPAAARLVRTTLSADLWRDPSDDTRQVVSGVDAKPPRKLRLRYPATCASCGISLSKGSEAVWNAAAKSVTCLACFPSRVLDSGAAGASAAAEAARRAERKVDEVRRKHGDHAAEVARQMAERDAAATWGKGSNGESRLANYIAREVGDRLIALHDRLIPGTRGNIDHIFVSPTGVWVVDAKAYEGKVVQREVGPLWRRDNELYIRGRNRTALARGVLRQVDAVLAAMRSDESLHGIDVNAVLCLVESEWALLDFPFQVGNVWVMYPGALKKRLRKSGPLSPEMIQRIGRRLDLSLPRYNAR